MNSDNVKTTPTSKVDYQKLLDNALQTHKMSTKEIIDNVCKLLDILMTECGEEYIYNCANCISDVLQELDVRTDVKSEDLNELSQHSEALNLYFITNIKNWIKDKHSTILNQKEFEYVDNHFGDCNSDNVQAVIQTEITVSSNDYDLEDFDVIEASTGAVGGLADTDDGFVLL